MKTTVWAATVLSWLALASLGASAPVDEGMPPSLGDIRFAADVVVTPAVDGAGHVRITYAVTYDDLVFLRNDEGFSSRYEVTAILYGRDWQQAAGDSWLRRVDVATYAETNSRALVVGDTLGLDVAPGTYRLRMEIRSVDTGATGAVEREVAVPEYEPGRLVLGTIVFDRAQAGPAPGVFVPNPSRDYGEEWPALRARVPVYGDPGARYRAELTIETDDGRTETTRVDTVLQTASMTEHSFEMSVLALDVGVHFLRVRVRAAEGGGPDAAVKARFRVLTSPKSWGEDFEKMLAQVGYIASRDEVERLREAPENGRAAAWAEFWRLHDPDPSTDANEFKVEFLRRLGHANMHFKSIIEGWQTDMGRIYIQYGEPDDAETQPVDKMLYSWEVWYYYGEHLKFTFVDTEGFGEFSLVETSRI